MEPPAAPEPPPAPEPVAVDIPDAGERSATPADPSGFAAVIRRLGGGSRRAGARPAAVVTYLLEDDELVQTAIVGRFRGEDGIAVLTDRRLFVANAREWAPEVVIVDDVGGLEVEGWVERRAATIRLNVGSESHVMDRIADPDVAADFTATLRSRAG